MNSPAFSTGKLRQKAVNTFLVTSCFFLTLFVFGTSNIYLTNNAEFLIFFKELLFYTIPLALFLAASLTAVLLLLGMPSYQKAVSLLIALSLLLWLQGNIMVWRYGPLDGSAIPWEKFWVFGAIDITIWLSLLLLAFIKSSFFHKLAKTTAMALLLIQLISVSLTAVEAREDSHTMKHYHVDESSKFEFSKEKNVILIILDEFQSNIFQEIVSQEDSYRNMFDGFIYFRNALSAFCLTELSIPAILTGELYDNSVRKSEFLQHAFLDNSIPRILKESGFEVDLFPYLSMAAESIYFDERIATNMTKRHSTPVKMRIKETARLIDLVLFRYLPHFAKIHVYNNREWMLHKRIMEELDKTAKKKEVKNINRSFRSYTNPNIEFAESLVSNARFGSERNVFKYYHLRGVHPPLMMNEKLEIMRMEHNKNNYTATAKGCLKICSILFDVLKQNGAYDNSLIFIMGDHGSGQSEDLYINAADDSHPDAIEKKSSRNFQQDKAQGIPLILVKRFNSRGEIETSDAPVSLIDVPVTIMAELNLEGDFPGESMFRLNQDDTRKRYYGAYTYQRQKSDFVNPITMYVVTGFSWSNESWDVLTILHSKEPSE